MSKISVIIPAYNAGRFLPECLDSVIAQSFSDFDVVVCDDGSSDDTAEIVGDYSKRDSRISYVHLDHVGAGAARNSGMERVSGEYLYFLDADDMIAPNALEVLYSAAQSHAADVVVARSHYLNDITKEESPIDFTMIDVACDVALTGDSLPSKPFQTFVGWPWDKLFRAEFVNQHGLTYQNLRSSNDAFFVYMALCKANCIVCVDKDLFTHRTNNASSLERTRSKSWNNAIAAMEAIRDEFSKDPRLGRCWGSFVNWTSHFSYWNMSTLGEGSLTSEVVNAFDEFLSSIDCVGVSFSNIEDAAFMELSHCDRLDSISSYIQLRKRNEELVNHLYSEERELMAEIECQKKSLEEMSDRLSAIECQKKSLEEMSDRLSAIECSRSYKLARYISGMFGIFKRVWHE